MTEQIQTPTKVFISYSWDSEKHKENVLKLANSLKNYGIDSKIDRYQQAPSEGWYRWMMNQIEESDFVLVVCTEKYNLRYRNKEKPKQGRGVTWEGGLIIEELYDGQGINDKFIPILLSSDDENYIPSSLRTYTVYRLFDPKYDPKIPGEFQNLYRRLTNQPEYEEPNLGKRLILPPIQPASSNVGGDGEIIKGEDLDNTQKTEQIQTAIKVFISYSRDSDDHNDKVLSLAQALLDDGIFCMIDQFVMSPDNWDRWMLDQIDESQFVLIICSERYYQRYRGREEVNRGMGVTWESTLIMGRLYNGQGMNEKFYPIFFSSPDTKIIPDGIRTSFYDLSKYDLLNLDRNENRLIESGGYQDLYRLLTKQPRVVPKKVGSIKKLEANTRDQDVLTDHKYPQKPPAESSLEQAIKEIEYRKKVEEYVNNVPLSKPYDEIDEIHKTSLETISQKIGLDTDKAKAIEDDVLQPRRQRHETYKKNLQKYQNLLMNNLEREGFLSDRILSDLKELQNNWELSEKDAEEALLYAQLEYSLKKGSWIEADATTTNLLLKVANVQQNYFSLADFRKIPCKDIRKIDQLWTDYSNGHFGYSAQIDIWQKFKGELFDFFVALDWGFYNEDRRFVYIDKFKYNLPDRPKGHLPALVLWEGGNHETRQAYIEIIEKCCKNVVR